VSATGTVAYDPNNGSVITSAGVRLGKPSAPQFTGIAPKPDGLNADAGGNVKLGKYGELSSKFSLNVAPDLSVSGSYKAKGTVTAPDGRSYEMEVSVERQADGTWNIKTPDGVTTDPTARPEQPELKGKAPETGPATGAGSWSDRFSFGAGVSVDKEFKTTPGAAPTKEEFDRAFADFAKAQSVQRQQVVDWKAVNRPEAVAREGLQAAEDSARAAEARGALPDLDRDGIPDEQDATPNQNDTDPTSTDVGDGPEGNAGYTGSTESGYSDSGFGDNTDSVDSGSGSFSGSLDSGSSGSSDSGSSSSYSDSGFGDSSGSVDSRAGYSDSGSSGGFDSGDGDSGGFGGDSGGF
jgi:hypothetical protein